MMYEEFVVDDTRYITNKYHTPDALRIFAILSKLIGKPFGILAGQGFDAEASKNLVGEAIDALTQNIDPDKFDHIVKDALKTTEIFTENRKRPIMFNNDFQGKTLHLFKVLKHVLMFQFADFLGELGTIIPAAVPMKKPEAGRIQAL